MAGGGVLESVAEPVQARERWATFEQVCRRHGLALVYLFGSRAREAVRLLKGARVHPDDPLADVDVGVLPSVLCPARLTVSSFTLPCTTTWLTSSSLTTWTWCFSRRTTLSSRQRP